MNKQYSAEFVIQYISPADRERVRADILSFGLEVKEDIERLRYLHVVAPKDTPADGLENILGSLQSIASPGCIVERVVERHALPAANQQLTHHKQRTTTYEPQTTAYQPPTANHKQQTTRGEDDEHPANPRKR